MARHGEARRGEARRGKARHGYLQNLKGEANENYRGKVEKHGSVLAVQTP